MWPNGMPPFFPYGYPFMPPTNTPDGMSIKKYKKMQRFMKEFEEEWKKKNDKKPDTGLKSAHRFLSTLGLMFIFGPPVGIIYLITMQAIITNLYRLIPH